MGCLSELSLKNHYHLSSLPDLSLNKPGVRSPSKKSSQPSINQSIKPSSCVHFFSFSFLFFLKSQTSERKRRSLSVKSFLAPLWSAAVCGRWFLVLAAFYPSGSRSDPNSLSATHLRLSGPPNARLLQPPRLHVRAVFIPAGSFRAGKSAVNGDVALASVVSLHPNSSASHAATRRVLSCDQRGLWCGFSPPHCEMVCREIWHFWLGDESWCLTGWGQVNPAAGFSLLTHFHPT